MPAAIKSVIREKLVQGKTASPYCPWFFHRVSGVD